MDSLLNNIFDLIGDTRGAKKAFLEALNLPSSTIGDWRSGRNKSYKKRLPEIADYFGVSVDYLTGKTDERTPEEKPVNDNIDGHDKEALDKEVLNLLLSLSPAQLEQAKTYLEFLSQKDNL